MLDLTIPAELDRRPFIGTYTNLHTFRDVCEEQFQRRYIKRDQEFVETEAIRFGNEAHAAMEKRVGQGKVLPDHLREWEKHATPFDRYDVACEQKLAINAKGQVTGYWDKDCFFRGKSDAVVMLNDKALLTDWKTSDPKYEDPFELQTNALLLKAKHPTLRAVVGRYIYLKHNQIGRMHDLSDFQATWLEINRLMNLVAEKRQSGIWEKRKSGLCGWCSVEDCPNWFVSEKRKV
jgi:hypothetical protein